MQGNSLLQKILGILVISTISMPAFAVMSLPFGWYLEANGGSTNISNISYPGDASTSGIGWNANLGYKFMPYVAAELGYTQYAYSTIRNSAGNKAGTDKHYSYDLAVKGIAPFYDSGFEGFGKIGIQRISASGSITNQSVASALGFGGGSHSATGVYLGIGAQYYVMPELAIVGQWARAVGNSNTGTADLLTGGLSFIFG